MSVVKTNIESTHWASVRFHKAKGCRTMKKCCWSQKRIYIFILFLKLFYLYSIILVGNGLPHEDARLYKEMIQIEISHLTSIWPQSPDSKLL